MHVRTTGFRDVRTLLLTGSSGSGKTTFLNRLAFECALPLTGLRSLRYYENGNVAGFDWEAKGIDQGEQRGENQFRWPLARFEKNRIFVEKETFYRGGIFLKKWMKQKPPWFFVDEVGRFEQEDSDYVQLLEEIEASSQPLILVLKKEELALNNRLLSKAAGDPCMRVLDLDTCQEKDQINLIDEIRQTWAANSSAVAQQRDQDPSVKRIRTILMASGSSRRFGKNKLLEEWDGISLIERSINLVATYYRRYPQNGVGICCAKDIEILRRAGDAGLIPLYNRFADEGICASIRLGLDFLYEGKDKSKPEMACFLTADQPLLQKESFCKFLAAAQRSPKGLFEARSLQQTGGSPVCFDATYYSQLRKLTGDKGGREILRCHREDLEGYILPEKELLDVDDPQDWEKLRQIQNGV